MIKLSTIIPRKDNPRKINNLDLERLKKSIKGFKRMMTIKPIIIDETRTILSGNMRYIALKELGYTSINDSWVQQEKGLTKKQKKEFIIKDNTHYGSWDVELLLDFESKPKLLDYGVTLMDFASRDSVKSVNELDEWGEDMPEYVPNNKKDIKAIFYFKTKKARDAFMHKHSFTVHHKMNEQYIVKI